MKLVFFYMLQKLFMEVFNSAFIEAKILPRIKNIFQKLVVPFNLLLIAIGEFLNINATHQFLHILIEKLRSLNTS